MGLVQDVQDTSSLIDQTIEGEVIGFGRRLAAYIIDGIILWVLASVTTLWFNPDEVRCLSFFMPIVYFVWFWTGGGQTPGKSAMGIKIISNDGSPVTPRKAFLRYIGYLVSGLVLNLGFVWIVLDERRQGWHDKIAQTYVVRKDASFSLDGPIVFVQSDAEQGRIWTIVTIIFALMPVFIIIILLLLGPIIGDVFSGIVEGLD